ncbi:hypothetical protein [Saccharibacter floricola]|uniref:Uncharacterized protein n=1 Tax=Saccharibacter floricola DSM 15669 TaxID=1123227 RepID=A0ABQ0P139_9PROT|nr:hypothetical protein [Saccharibacter floricola]GBQ08825.1 hypothetical protein AA15669_1923 [Saccharibacter floricola DSM 15669]
MTIPSYEINNNKTPLGESLGRAISNISYGGEIYFQEYRKITLPLDGFLFWIKTENKFSIPGSLHISTRNTKNEYQNYDLSQIVLSTSEKINKFHQKDSNYILVGIIDGLEFLIGAQKESYQPSALFHYSAESIPPSFRSQFIHTEAELDDYHPVISSSLPIFLALPHIGSPALGWCPWPKDVPIFPSFSSPDNQEPPYIIIHNDPHSAQPVGLGTVDPTTGASTQMMTEKVKLTLIGLPHQKASNIRDYIRHWALLHPDTLGITNIPVIVDEKSTLDEISALSMMKHLEFDVMYIQNTARDCAFKLIEHAKMTLKSNTRTVPSS